MSWKPAIGGEAPPKRRGLAGPLLAGTAIAAVAGTLASQWVASRLGHHPKLGEPLLFGWHAPWSWLVWRGQDWPAARPVFETLDTFLMAALCVTPGVLAWAAQQGKNKPKKHEGVHGTARLATREDLVKAALLPRNPSALERLIRREQPAGNGWYLALHEEADGTATYIRHEGVEHIGVWGPTRVGKTAGPAVMNLLSGEDESVIAYDSKGSLWRDTAGWRKSMGNRVLRWDLMALTDRVRWNPLREVRLRTIHEYTDTANVIEHLADPSGEGLDGSDHFPPVAAEFLVGLALLVLYERRARGVWACMGDVLHALDDPDREPAKLYKAMAENRFGPNGTRHPQIAAAGTAQAKRPDKERGSVHSTAGRMLRLFRDPIIVQNTAVSDFSIADLMDADDPVSLYVIPREESRLRLRPITRLFNSMMAARLASVETARGSNRPHRHRLRIIYDEFTADGAQEGFISFMARCAEFGIRVMLLLQDYQQILKEYGRDETVSGACAIKVGYTPNNQPTAEWMAGWTGRATLHTEDVSESGSSGEAKRGFNRSIHTVSRNLLTDDEVERLDPPAKDPEGRIVAPGKVLVKKAGAHCAMETQALWFFDDVFKARADISPPPTDTMRSP